MAVMSQGELQALGLAVFLPRACAEESPFRFVIIDDPVQSMDPSKVDGLARVLHTLAQTRQVVVFTHDNRLPEAIRRLDVPATIWEVVRQNKSVVTSARTTTRSSGTSTTRGRSRGRRIGRCGTAAGSGRLLPGRPGGGVPRADPARPHR